MTYRSRPGLIPLPAMVRLKCDKCGRKGQYRRERYVEMADLPGWGPQLLTFAKTVGCPWALNPGVGWDEKCRVVHDWTPEQKARIMAGLPPE